jgi:hypothetical protein
MKPETTTAPRRKRGRPRKRNKYAALGDWLARQGSPWRVLQLREIDEIVDGLPETALHSRSWWSGTRSYAQSAWIEAGYVVERLNLSAGWVLFRRLEDSG